MERKKTNACPFPQANDMEKVIRLVKIPDEKDLQSISKLSSYLGVSDRQVYYYLSACLFLDILTPEHNFTPFGLSLRKKGFDEFNATLAKSIIAKPVFGEVFFARFIHGDTMSIEDISELISMDFKIESEGLSERRASTVRNWINWIYSLQNIMSVTHDTNNKGQ